MTHLHLRLVVAATILVGGAIGAASRAPANAQGGLAGEWRIWANADDVLSLAAQGDVIWAGSRHGGLVRWDAAGTYEQYLSPQDPLPGNIVRAIAIDARGWKWLATDNGLAALDEHGSADRGDDTWLVYTRESTSGGLPTDDLWAVAADGTSIWVGGSQINDPETGDWQFGGLGRLETGGTFAAEDDSWAPVVTFDDTFSKTPDGRETLGLVSDSIRGLLPVDGGVWIGTAPHWIWESNESGDFYWGTVHGGLSFVRTGGTFDPSDDLWDAYSCMNSMRDATGRPVLGCTMGPIVADGAGNAWVAAGGLGAVAFGQNQRPLTGRGITRFDDEAGLNGSAALTVARAAADHAVWIGLRDAGAVIVDYGATLADRADDVSLRFDKAAGLPRNRVQAIAAGTGTAWLGTGPDLGVGGGIAGLDPGGAIIGTLLTAAPAGRAPVSNFVTDLAVAPPDSDWDGGIWMATGSRKQQRFGSGVALLSPGPTGRDDVWEVFDSAGTDDNGEPPFSGLTGDNVQTILIDGARVWFGSAESLWDARRGVYRDGGLSVFSQGRWTARTAGTGLQDGSVTSLALGCDGRVWAGTGVDWSFGRGVDVLATDAVDNPGADTWEHLAFPNLPSDNVRGIAHRCDADESWVAGIHSARGGFFSDGGVSRRDAAGTWTRYDVTNGFTSFGDGVVTGEATSLFTKGEDVWAGAFGTAETTEQDLIIDAPYWPAAVNRWHDGVWTATVFSRLGWIADLTVDTADRVWAAASRGGLARSGEIADSWIEDADHVGLMVRVGETWQPMANAQGLPIPDVSAVAAAENGDVWIASEGWGLARYSERIGPTPTPSSTGTATPTPVDGSPTDTPTGTGTADSPTPSTPASATPVTETATATPSEGVPTTPAASATPTPSSLPPPHRLYLPALNQSRS